MSRRASTKALIVAAAPKSPTCRLRRRHIWSLLPGIEPDAGERRQTARLNAEILRLRVVDDDRRGGLFRVDLELVGQRHADAAGVEQPEDRLLVFQPGAGRVAEAVAAAV